MNVSASGSFGTVSASALIIPELHNQAIQTPQITQNECADRRIMVQVTDSEWGDPSGLSRSGPDAFAQFPFKWLAKLPGSTTWTTIINESGNTDQYPIPSTPLSTIGVLNGQIAGNPIVDSAIYATGEVVLNLGGLPDSLNGTVLKFQLQNYQGHFLESDSIVLTIENPHSGPILNSNPLGSIVIPGAILSYQTNFDTIHTYHWVADGGAILSGQGTDSITVQWGGPNQNAKMILIAIRGGCSDSTVLPVVITFLNNSELAGSHKFTIYPNPATRILHVEVPHEKLGSSYTLIDGLGKVLLEGVFQEEFHSLDISGMKTGIYTLKIITGQAVITSKIQIL